MANRRLALIWGMGALSIGCFDPATGKLAVDGRFREVGANEIASENGRLRAYVQSNVQDRDLGGFVNEVEQSLKKLDWGSMTYQMTGEYENQRRFVQTMQVVFPIVLLIIFVLLFPDGHFVPRWTRWLIPGWAVLNVVSGFLPPDHLLGSDGPLATLILLLVLLGVALAVGGVLLAALLVLALALSPLWLVVLLLWLLLRRPAPKVAA